MLPVSQSTQSIEESYSVAASSSMQQTRETATTSTTPLSPPSPPPAPSISKPLPLSQPNAKGKTRDLNEQGPREEYFDIEDGNAMDTSQDAQLGVGNDVESRPTRTTRTRNSSPLEARPSENKRDLTKRKWDNTSIGESSGGVPEFANLDPESYGWKIRNIPFPKLTMPQRLPEVTFVIDEELAAPKETPSYTLYCTKGEPHE